MLMELFVKIQTSLLGAFGLCLLLTGSHCPQPTPRVPFKTINIYPLLRCPGEPVAVEWSVSGGTANGVELSANDVVLWESSDNQGSYEIPAEVIDALPSSVQVAAHVKHPDGATEKFSVETISKPRTLTRLPVLASDTIITELSNYRDTLPSSLWSDSINVEAVALASVDNDCPDRLSNGPDTYKMLCTVEHPGPDGVSVQKPLDRDTDYRANFPLGTKAKGVYEYFCRSDPQEGFCSHRCTSAKDCSDKEEKLYRKTTIVTALRVSCGG